MPVLVQNTGTGPVVFSNGEKVQIEWKGKGDPNGDDVQYVSDEVFKDPQFERALRKGILHQVQEQDVQDVLARQDASFSDRSTQEAQAALESIDAAPANDFVFPVDGENLSSKPSSAPVR